MNDALLIVSFACAATTIAVIYPYLLYPILLRFLPKRGIRIGSPPNSPPSCALLFCAYNEEKSLPGKIENLRAIKAKMPALRIAVYSDASSDASNELLSQAADLLTLDVGEQRIGKSLGMRRLIQSIDAEIVLLTDANVLIDADTLPKMLHYFDDPEVGAVAGKLIYTNADDDANAVAHVGGLYWRLEEHIKALESASGSMMGADGSLFAIRRECYPDVPPELSDDMSVSMSVMFSGLRCVSAPEVYAYENCVTKSDEEFTRKRRVSCGSYSTHRYFRKELRQLPLINRFKWFSHRVVRWWGGPLLVLSVLLFISAGAIAGYPIGSVAFVVGAFALTFILGRFGVSPFSAVYEILRAMAATTIGVFEALLGKTYLTWSPAASR